MRRLMELSEDEMNEFIDDAVDVMQMERKNFILKVYGTAIIFLSLTWLQVLPLLLIDDVKEFFRRNYFILYIAIAFFYILQFSHIVQYPEKSIKACSMIIALLELQTIALIVTTWCATYDVHTVGAAFSISLSACVGLTFLAVICPADFTDCPMFLGTWKLMIFFTCFVIAVVYIFHKLRVLLIIFFCLIIVFLSIFFIFKTQLLFGSRRIKLKIRSDWLHVGFLIFIDETLLFIFVLPLFGRENF